MTDPDAIRRTGLLVLWERIKTAGSKNAKTRDRHALKKFREMCREPMPDSK